jgi:GAF domain-containing protein
MRRRSRAGSEPVKTRRRKTAARKRGNAPKAVRHSSSSASGPEAEVVRLTRELVEAREQQTATGDVLKVISRSAFDLQAVLNTLVESAARLCEADTGLIRRREGDTYPVAATFGVTAQQRQHFASYPTRPDRGSAFGRAILKGRIVHIPDVLADPEFDRPQLQSVGRFRAVLAVPLMREGVPIGALGLMRSEPRPFTDEQIALVQNFADQAVIAIENTRLLNELRQRTTDLSESLQQQTATADVLKVISRSKFELQPVLDTLVKTASILCGAENVVILRLEGDDLRLIAHYGPLPAPIGYVVPAVRGTVSGRSVLERRAVHVADLQAETEAYAEGSASARELGHHTIVAVPLLREGVPLGTLNLRRNKVEPFTDKQIELATTFADQAVIAIENTRLLNELHQRTSDLTESLEQQTATSEVLKVISSSPGELKPVFNAMLENATRLCEAKFGVLFRSEGDGLRAVALHGAPLAYAEERRRNPIIRPILTPQTTLGRAVATKQTVQIADVLEEPNYFDAPPGYTGTQLAKLAGARTILAVPMIKENELMGAIVIYRQEVRPFTNKQVELVTNFAAQAVIAIENARLLNELRESLQQQTATADVLKVISTSPGELEPVFRAMLENAVRICEAKFGTLFRFEGDAYRAVATHNAPQELMDEYGRHGLRKPTPGGILDRMLRTKQVCHTADYATESVHGTAARFGGARSIICVPMLQDNVLIGAFSIYRQEVRPFTDKQIALLENFAAQAVIAIENTRLLNELRQRTTDLSESLEQQTATSEVLKVISLSPGDLQPVFSAMLESAARLCDASFGNIFRWDDDALRLVATYNTPAAFAEARSESPLRRNQNNPIAEMLAAKTVLHVNDLAADERYTKRRDPNIIAAVELGGIRTFLAVPMLKDNELIGALIVYRQEVRPFSDKQIELLQNFAAQAVIAIENARLLNELRQRTADLSESLEQQTATADVLRVISSSPTDIQPVLEAIVRTAGKLCDAEYAILYRLRDGKYHPECWNNAVAEWVQYLLDHPLSVGRGSLVGRTALERRAVHILDCLADAEYTMQEAARIGNQRTMLGVPLLRDGVPIGVIGLLRTSVKPFTEKQIELVTTFADQAVIAIENTRLLNELRQSLQQQTATADVLKVISRSTFDLKSVLNTLVESIARLCEADMAAIRRPKGSAFLHVASHGSPTEYDDYMQSHPIEPDRGTVAGRVLLEGKPVHVADVQADPEYTMVDISRTTGYHTILGLPLLREGNPIGVVILGRATVRPFTEKQVELATTFADQAVIAIENVRLFDEIQDKSRQLEEASQHKSQFLANMSHELRTPLNAILGYTELMADGAYGEPSEKMLGILKRLEANGRHLLGLINDVLDLSKIEAGQLVLELSDYCVQDIAQTVRSTLEPLAADKNLAFKVEMGTDLPPGRGDGRRLTQVLINLVGNAIKFTDAGEVAIKAEANNGSFHVSVRDTGPGISAADQAKLFQEFQQADNAITRKKGGTGLGLAISKRIIEMHGGRIWVESQPGQGSIFTFTLPVTVERQVEAA